MCAQLKWEDIKQAILDYAVENYPEEELRKAYPEFPYSSTGLSDELAFRDFIDWFILERVQPSTRKTIAREFAEKSTLGQMGRLQATIYLNSANAALLAVAIVGLWRMKRWGFWLMIALCVVGLVSSCYSTVLLMRFAETIMTLPASLIALNLVVFSFSGPIQLVMASLIIVYLSERRSLFR